MLALRRLFKLPGPKELGMSSSNALPSREFTPDVEGVCWEDWHQTVKEMHPIKYWIAETAADYIKYNIWFTITRPIKRAHYWLISHTIRRYHILDLRQPDEYKYGWQDTDTRILYANFNLLNEFVKHEMPNFYCPTLEECENEQFGFSNKAQRDAYFKILDLHNWWNYERKIEQFNIDNLRDAYHHRKYDQKIRDQETEKMWNSLQEAETNFADKETDMLINLIKIRRSLWT